MQGTLNIPSAKSKDQFRRIETGIHISASGGIYETTKKEIEPDSYNTSSSGGTNYPWAKWGRKDDYPQQLIDAVSADPAATLLEKRAALHWGAGLMFYNKKVDEKGNERIEIVPEEKVPAEIQDFMWLNDWPNFQQGIINDFEWWHQLAVQYITNYKGKVLQVKWQRRKDVRAELRNINVSGEIENYYLSGRFGMGNMSISEAAKVPAFNKFAPTQSGIYMHRLVSIDKDYNPQPAWHGITRWLNIAAKIPRWILANIDNSINIKYHVKIPMEYFLKRHPIEAYKSSDERNAAIQKDETELYQKIDQYLAGEANVGKAFYSKVAMGEDGKPLPGWEIIPINNEINHEAWLKAYGTASMAITSGMALSPSISGQILPNGLGSGSGSDLREQFNFYMQVMTAMPRQTTLEPWEMVKRLNGWPKELHMGYKDVILQSTDQSKGGFAKQNEQAPTSDSQQNNKTQP
jgi:hypothetical protein